MTQSVRLTWSGGRVQAQTRAELARRLRLAAEHLLTESRKVVPIEEGTLERSGAVTVDAAALEAVVSYDTRYAVRQHEELDWRHDPGRTAKYLERPLIEQTDTLIAIVGADLIGGT